MANGIDLDSLDDEAFMQAIDDLAYEQEPEAQTNIEDTDPQGESEPEATDGTETNESNDDGTQDTGAEDEDDFDQLVEENSQAENGNQGDGSEGEDETKVEADDTTGSNQAGNEADKTEAGDAKESEGTADKELDYKAEYAKILEEKARYEDFYNQVTSEFIANGKKTKGFDDPKKIIQAQQMAAGLGEKMAAFKPYRPFMNTLKEKGMLENPEKFNLAMQLLDGDPEALKKKLKEAEIDPFEMDMENINYVPKNQVANDIEIALDDVMQSASQYGVDEQVRKIISNDWDDDSVIELLEDPQNSNDLINHLNSGVYDIVQDRIAEKRRSDFNQTYSSKTAIEQYREASLELEGELRQYMEAQQGQPEPVAQGQQQEVNTQPEQTNWIDGINDEQKNEYTQKVEKQNAQTNEARRKATSLSKKKRGTRKPKKQVDPLQMNDEDFTAYMDALILTN